MTTKFAIRDPQSTGEDILPNPSRFTANSKRASEVAKAGWLMVDATSEQVRKHFKTISVAEGLSLLAKAREHLEIAAFELNQRIEEGVYRERCSGCGKTLEEIGRAMWIMQGAERDAKTGLDIPYRYCSPMCVRERNRRKLMPQGADPIAADGSELGDIR